MSDFLLRNFRTYLSTHEESGTFLYSSVSVSSKEECATACRFDSGAQCSFFMYEATECHFGNPSSSNTPPAMNYTSIEVLRSKDRK